MSCMANATIVNNTLQKVKSLYTKEMAILRNQLFKKFPKQELMAELLYMAGFFISI